MRESKFITDNQEKWNNYEKDLEKELLNPERLNEIFINVTDDLSYARTFYKNRSVRVYLNGLAQRIFQRLYATRQSPIERFKLFWQEELPRLVYESRGAFRLSLFIFLLSFLIGAFSTRMDADFPRIILGNDYVEMTLENIKKGDPMAVYKQHGQFGMSAGITMNNIFVAFLTFVMGIFAAIGAVAILIRNGIMVGAFQYFFYQQGVLQESVLTIWMHGTLEISAIVIAGAAGIIMGSGLLFPGTLPRKTAFQASAQCGLKIMVSLVPVFITAGFIEGYLTRHTELPDLFRAVFILLCLVLVLWYFVWYPIQKSRQPLVLDSRTDTLVSNRITLFEFYKIKTIGELLSDSFRLYQQNMIRIARWAAGGSLVYFLGILLSFEDLPFIRLFEFRNIPGHLEQFFVHESIPLLPVVVIISFSLFIVSVQNWLFDYMNEACKSTNRTGWGLTVLKTLIPVTLGYLMIRFGDSYAPLLLLLFFPVCLLWQFQMQRTNSWYLSGIQMTFRLLGAAYLKLIIASGVIFLFGWVMVLLLDTQLFWFFVDFISWNLPFEGDIAQRILNSILLFAVLFVLFFLLSLLLLLVGFYTFSQLELKEATVLKQQIETIDFQKGIRGLARENSL